MPRRRCGPTPTPCRSRTPTSPMPSTSSCQRVVVANDARVPRRRSRRVGDRRLSSRWEASPTRPGCSLPRSLPSKSADRCFKGEHDCEFLKGDHWAEKLVAEVASLLAVPESATCVDRDKLARRRIWRSTPWRWPCGTANAPGAGKLDRGGCPVVDVRLTYSVSGRVRSGTDLELALNLHGYAVR
jgi:hypothetical protein